MDGIRFDIAATSGSRAEAAAKAAARKEPGQAAQQFEELFASMLVKELRRALPEGFFGGGSGADVYEGWLDEHLGRELARGGRLGIGDAVRADLTPRASRGGEEPR